MTTLAEIERLIDPLLATVFENGIYSAEKLSGDGYKRHAALLAAIKAVVEDAERYRWLRLRQSDSGWTVARYNKEACGWDGNLGREALDALVDAARKGDV